MATNNIPTPVVHTYKEINIGKYKTTQHFEVVEVKNGQNYISEKLNISINRNCALSMPVYWLKAHNGKKWVTPFLTGLFKTKNPNIYYGDINKRTHLLLFVFSNNRQTLKIYFFKNYYTKDINQLMPFIDE